MTTPGPTSIGRRLGTASTIAVGLATLLVIGATGRVRALPAYEVHTVYYDGNAGIVAEHIIDCSGAHYDWGDKNLAEPGQYGMHYNSCGTAEPAYKYCWGAIDGQGNFSEDGCAY